MAKKMQIRLLPNGEIRMETQGVKGKKCDDYVELFKKLVKSWIIFCPSTGSKEKKWVSWSQTSRFDSCHLTIDMVLNKSSFLCS